MSAKRAQEPRLRRPMSAAQRAKLSATQRAYVARDPRWPAHRRKLMDANLAKRRTLAPDQIAAAVTMVKQGRTPTSICETLGVHHRVLRRELGARGIAITPRGGKRTTLSPDEIAAVLTLLRQGRSLTAICEAFGIGDRPLRRELGAHGIPTPKRGGKRMTLLPDEIAAITAMRNKGRTFSYIAEEIGIDDGVLRREFRANGFSTARVRPERRAKPGTGPWRSFDEPGCLHAYRNVLQGP